MAEAAQAPEQVDFPARYADTQGIGRRDPLSLHECLGIGSGARTVDRQHRSTDLTHLAEIIEGERGRDKWIIRGVRRKNAQLVIRGSVYVHRHIRLVCPWTRVLIV